MIDDVSGLPRELSIRPLAQSDAPAVFSVMAEQQLHDLGRVEIEEADIVADWQRPSFDVSASTLGVFDGTDLVGYAEVGLAGRGDAAVRPSYNGRGIGTVLARWMQHRARAIGYDEIGLPVPEGSPGDRLLDSLGYRVRWTSWVLHLPAGAEIEGRPLPDGYTARQALPVEYRAVYDVIEDAFLEWAGREREAFEDFEAEMFLRPGIEPWNVRVVTATDGSVAGAAIVFLAADGEAYVSRLATRRDQRHQGIAQVLLADAFGAAREHGAVRCSLSTDSRTGALALYERVGMIVTEVWVNRAITVTLTGDPQESSSQAIRSES